MLSTEQKSAADALERYLLLPDALDDAHALGMLADIYEEANVCLFRARLLRILARNAQRRSKEKENPS